MNVKLVFACAVVLAAAALLLAVDVSAQTSHIVTVSDAVEPVPGVPGGGVVPGGVSAARCGENVVVGFGDSESGNTNSRAGYSVSTNDGKSFRDLGVLPVSTQDVGNGPDALGGNILSLACGDSNHFYYAAPYFANNFPAGFPCDPSCVAISVSISRDGGASWGLPQVVAGYFFDTHQIDSPSIALDPTNPQHVYVAYLDQNFIGPFDYVFPECYGYGAMELRVVSSSDGGTTWSPNVVDHVCQYSADPEKTGLFAAPKLAVSPDGKIYLTYEFHPFQPVFGPPPGPNEIRFTRSLDQGNTFSTPIVVSTEAIDSALPQLAVDRTESKRRGTIYLTWSGSPTGSYTDVLVSESADFGVSFSFPRSISPAPEVGTGRFQTNPVVAVDRDGEVAACFYSTPTNSPMTSSVYSYDCATSFNHAATWETRRMVSSAPVGFDALTSDFLLGRDGFFTAFEVQANGQTHVVGANADLD